MSWKSLLVSLTTVALLSSPLWIPHLLWRAAPLVYLRLLVVNYTVPTDKYRNHLGLFWLLNHLKITDQLEKGKLWRKEDDYVGFRPGLVNGGTRLHEANLSLYDWVYVVDTYGVWLEASNVGTTEVATPGERPKLVFGGLAMRDVEELSYFAGRGKNIILEFNSFDGPTQREPREAAESLVAVRTTGWAGCFLPNPSDNTSVPAWFPRLFASKHPGKPLPSGPAMLFIHTDGRMLLLDGERFERTMPSLVMTEAGRKRFPGVRGTPPYFGWFSIVLAGSGVETLAELRLPTPDHWKKRLEKNQIPDSFPLLTSYQSGGSYRYYLAANLSNMDEVPDMYQMAGLPWLEAAVHRRRDSFSFGPAYWQFFVPLMRHILTTPASKGPAWGEGR